MREWRCRGKEFRRGVVGPCGQLLARFEFEGFMRLETKCPRCRAMQTLRVEAPVTT